MPVTGKGGKQYDISIVRTDGTTEVGFMLDESGGKKRYERVTDPALAQQFFTGDVDYGKMEPEKELALIQSNYEAGFGLEFADSVGTNKFRYYTSVGCDCRFKNNVILGPVATAITLVDYSATITDGGLELWDDATTLTNWTEGGVGALDRETGTVKTGTYSAKCSTVASDMSFAQSLSWDTKYQSVEVKISAYVYQDTASRATLRIFDGTDTTNGAASATTGSWVELTCTHTLNAGAAELTISVQLANTGGLAITFVDDFTWSYPAASVAMKRTAHAQFNDELYIGSADVLLKLNGTGNGFTYVRNFGGAAIQSLETFVDDNMYVGLGSGTAYYYMNTSESFTQSTLGGNDQEAFWFRNVNGVMYKWLATNVVSKASDPTNAGSWSTATTVGTQDDLVFEIKSIAGTPYIGKGDIPYYLDGSDNDFPITEDVRFLDRTLNCIGMNSWHDTIYVPIGTDGLMEYDGTTITWRSPSRFCTNLPDHTTQIIGVAGDEEYLYILQDKDTGTVYPLLAGKPTVIEGSAVWVWHPVQHIDTSSTGIPTGSLFISSVYKKRIWFSHSTGTTAKMFWLPLTTQYGDIIGDSNYTFQTGGYVITPWLHSNLKSDDKAFHKLTLTTEDCDANNYVTVDYQTYFTALSGTWTNLGNFTTSPTQTRFFSNVTGTMIRFRFTLVTNSTSTTPKLTNYDTRGIWRPTKRQLIACTVKLGDNILPRTGQTSESYQSMKNAIDEAVNQVKPNTFYGIDGAAISVNLLGAREFDVELVSGQNQPTSKYELLFEEIITS